MEHAPTLPAIDKGRGTPADWWCYDIFLDGVLLPGALQATAGERQRVTIWIPKPSEHRKPEDPDPLAGLELLKGDEGLGAGNGLFALTQRGTVEIRLKPPKPAYVPPPPPEGRWWDKSGA